MIILGLISGTSVDGIDAALVEVSEANGKIQAQPISKLVQPSINLDNLDQVGSTFQTRCAENI